MKLPPPTMRMRMSSHPRATVHVNGDARHVSALVAREEKHYVRHLTHLGQSAERGCLQHGFSLAVRHLLPMLLESRSADRERRDETVDVDAVRTKFLCQVASEANDAKLGADVGDCHRPIPADAARGARGCVDDLAVVLALHQRGGSPRA